jgi:signal transduction histidine kinase
MLVWTMAASCRRWSSRTRCDCFCNRGANARARPAGASGLALTICRAIVEAHGDRIWFVEAQVGTRVRFSLPSVDGR